MAEQTAISHALKLSHLLIKSQSNSNSRHIKEFLVLLSEHSHTDIKHTGMLNLLTVTWDVNPFILTGILLLIWSARKGGPARIQNNTIRHGANQQH